MSARRCPWCGDRLTWRDGGQALRYGTCRYCADLERELRALYGVPMRAELRQAVKQR